MLIETDRSMLPELNIYASLNEPQLKRYHEPAPGLFIAETANVIERALRAGYRPVSMLIDRRLSGGPAEEVLRLAYTAVPEDELPVYLADLDVISSISGFQQTRGMLAAMRRRPLPALSDILEGASRIAVLENVENPTNVGAVFRSAAAIGFDAVVLTRRSADPLYRRAARVSMGTVFQIPWTFVGGKRKAAGEDASQEGSGAYEEYYGDSLDTLRDAGFRLAAMALDERAVPVDDPGLKAAEKLALLFGNEEEGLLERTLDACDHIVKIPMMNGVDSLNVAAASAVAFWELRKRKD